MTCAENRERLSALLDGELARDERALVEAHLASCPECSGELAHLARMLGMLHALPAERAPIGFVDRVMTAARPTPWYARLGRHLVQPWRVKIPLEVAALLVVALGAVYVFQKTPELQQAARQEAPAPPPPAAPEPAAPTRGPQPAPSSAAKPAERKEEPGPPATAPAPPSAAPARDATRVESPTLESAMKEEVAPPGKSGAKDASGANLMKDAARPAAPPEGDRAREKKAATGRSDAPPATQEAQPEARSQRLGRVAPSAPSAARQLVAPDASGRLAVGDREAAERALADLRARLGATEALRREAADGVLVEVLVPRTAFADFARGLHGIGHWTWDRDPTTLPEHVRLQILLVR
jgi:Putative zinc-finger